VKIAVWHNLPSGGGKRALYYFSPYLGRRRLKGLTEEDFHDIFMFII